MKARFFSAVIRYRWWILISSLVLVMAAAMGAQRLVFKGDYRVFFSEENPQLLAFEAMQKIYSKSDNVAFILSPKDGEVFTASTLQAVQELTEAAWQTPYSTRVDSITNYQHTTAVEDDLTVADLVDDPANLSGAELADIKAIATTEPLLVHKLISPQGHVTVVNVTTQLPGISPVTEVPEVVEKVREIKAAFEQAHPDVEVRLSGMIMMNQTFSEASMSDSATLVPLMFLMVIVGISLLLRTLSGTLSTVVIIIYSIVATMGLAGWLDGLLYHRAFCLGAYHDPDLSGGGLYSYSCHDVP
ncbi:MMPL family transporter [Balneatrix alpica]|uniref:MMPL family transporter n=1 Tax=Balneatrix alpica TaxID=75684 RepID=A0ABV5ZF89_9GAMM|nr:MMPL family transporter [Balneatrix alpica]